MAPERVAFKPCAPKAPMITAIAALRQPLNIKIFAVIFSCNSLSGYFPNPGFNLVHKASVGGVAADNADSFNPFKPLRADRLDAVEPPGRGSRFFTDLDHPGRFPLRPADYQDQINLPGELLGFRITHHRIQAHGVHDMDVLEAVQQTIHHGLEIL